MTTNIFSPLSFVAVLDLESGMAKNQDPESGIKILDLHPWISCLDSSLGRVPACDTGDPGSIPGGGNLNFCLQLGSRVIINIMHLFLHPPPPTPPQVHNVESHNLLEI
jgi:hypothetical protein